eukprot:2720277-Prymnesium_polylepis.1
MRTVATAAAGTHSAEHTALTSRIGRERKGTLRGSTNGGIGCRREVADGSAAGGLDAGGRWRM